VRAVSEGRADDVELVLDAPGAAPQRCDVVLALPFHAAKDRVALRVAGLLELERPGRIVGSDARGAVAGIAGQAAEDEAVEARVVPGQLEAECPDGAPQPGLDRLRDLDLEIWIADVERRRRVVGAAREQLGRLRGALDILSGDAGDEIPRQVLDQPDAA